MNTKPNELFSRSLALLNMTPRNGSPLPDFPYQITVQVSRLNAGSEPYMLGSDVWEGGPEFLGLYDELVEFVDRRITNE